MKTNRTGCIFIRFIKITIYGCVFRILERGAHYMRRAGALIYDTLRPGAKRLLTVLGVASMARAAAYGRRLNAPASLDGVRRALNGRAELDPETLNGFDRYLPEKISGARSEITQLRSGNAPAHAFLDGVRRVLRDADRGAFGQSVSKICELIDWDRSTFEDAKRFREWFFKLEPGRLRWSRETLRRYGGDAIEQHFEVAADCAWLERLSAVELRMFEARRKYLTLSCLLSPDAVASAVYGHNRNADDAIEHGLYLVIREARRGGPDVGPDGKVELHRDVLWLYEASERDEVLGPLAKPVTRALYLPWRSDATRASGPHNAAGAQFSEPCAFAMVKAPPNSDAPPNMVVFWGDGTAHKSPHRISLTTTDLVGDGGSAEGGAHVGFLTGMHGDEHAPAAWRVLIARPSWEERVEIERDLVSFTKDRARANYLRQIGATSRLINAAPDALAGADTPQARMFLQFKAMMSGDALSTPIFDDDAGHAAARIMNMTTYLHSHPPRAAFEKVASAVGLRATFDKAVDDMLKL